jgi:hypothetical protein
MGIDSKRQQLIGLVGQDNVCDDPARLNAYCADQSFAPPIRPWFVVRPQTAADVQGLVRWASETATPLVPVSSGPPHFNGDTVPSVAEAVMVDLSGMKKIIRIDRRNKIVVIEPGVTYAELQPALAEQGLRIAQPLLPRQNKSVIASLLERQPTTIPRLNYSLPEPLRVCGVVWGTGDYAFTGEAGGGPLSLEAQWQAGLAQVDQKGPLATDLMRLVTGAQGTMGIVVWASVKCELIATARKTLLVKAEKLEELIDFCYQVERLRLGDEVMILNRRQLNAALGKTGGCGCCGSDWVVVIGLAGSALYPQEKVDVQEHELQTLLKDFGLDALEAPQELTARLQSCSGPDYWKLATNGACQEIFFLTTLDKVPGFCQTVAAVAARYGYPASDLGVYVQPQHHGVSQHVEFSLPYDPADKCQAEAVKAIYTAASEALIAEGAYFSRPYGYWADLVYNRDATATRVLRTVKQIVDPKQVLNPGKLCF